MVSILDTRGTETGEKQEVGVDRIERGPTLATVPTEETRLRFQESSGRLRAVEIRRSGRRPVVSRLHGALLALGVVITAYHAELTPGGLDERLELEAVSGGSLDGALSARAKTAILPLVLAES
jgi:hypothetical protein